MKKLILSIVTVVSLLGMPAVSHAQYSESAVVNPVVLIGGGRHSIVGAPISILGGQVLGAFTSIDVETQAKIDTVKVQLRTLISQLISLLQQQLAAAITAGGQ